MSSRRTRARAMRCEPTEAEEALWELLRRRALVLMLTELTPLVSSVNTSPGQGQK